jgi:PAS domain S-box-containing protein
VIGFPSLWKSGSCGARIALACTAFFCANSCTESRHSPGPFRIGYGGDRPLHYRDADGQPAGLAVAVVQEAAKHRGIRLEWVPATNAVSDLQAGRIDLFVLLTPLPERRKLIYLTQPYLATEAAFLVAQSSRFKAREDLSVSRIAINNLEVQRLALRKQFPNSTIVALGSTADAIVAIQDGRADAAYVDQYAGIIGLMEGAAKQPLRIIPSTAPVRQLSLASTFRNQAVADELRDEIGDLAERQQLAAVLARWSMFPVLMAESADALNVERRKVRFLGQGALGLSALLLLVLFLLWKLRQRAFSLAESEARFRSLAEAAFEGVMIHDGTRILEANEQFARLFGYDSPLELTGPDGPPKMLDDESQARIRSRSGSNGGLNPIEIAGIRKDGTRFPAETQGCDSIYRGRKVRVVAMRDMSERKRSEEERHRLEVQLSQAQKMESIGRLAGGVAHDFNNLLTVINGYSRLILQDSTLTDRTRGRVENVHKAGQRAADLTAQLLAFSRKQVIEPRPLNLNKLVAEIQEMLSRLLPENITTEYRIQKDLGLVLADPGQMHQVLLNLILNARDAMPDGGLLSLETGHAMLDARDVAEHPDAVPGPCVTLAITDTGVGMPPEVLSHIFEPFYTTKAHSGTGLGLATAYGIIRQNGGWISVASEPERGTAFKIFLPLADARREPEPELAEPEPQAGAGTILVVEDQDDLRDLVAEILQSHGYLVLHEANGYDALTLATRFSGRIDLLLTDVIMPGITGKQLADRLQSVRPETKILYMSGYAENAIVTGGTLQPGIAFLPKPLTPESLLAKVAWALRG